MKVTASKDFKKQFKKYDKKLQQRLSNAIDKIPSGNIERIQGKKTPPLFRLRVGNYRIIFRMNEDELFLEWVDSRGDVYKSL